MFFNALILVSLPITNISFKSAWNDSELNVFNKLLRLFLVRPAVNSTPVNTTNKLVFYTDKKVKK